MYALVCTRLQALYETLRYTMGKHNFENIRKQAYLLGNRNGGLGFDSPRLHHFLLGNRGIWKCMHLVCTF